MSQKWPRIGVGAVAVRDGKVLVGRRKGAHGAGDWSFAGGHLEFGETVEECALRELYEETGLRGSSCEKGPWVNNRIEDKHYVTLFIFIPIYEGDPVLKEPEKCEGWQWSSWRSLPKPLFPSIVSLIAEMGLDKLESIGLSTSLLY